MAKPPPDIPAGVVGERVTLRANHERNGTITATSPLLWMNVIWDDGARAPKICHQYELVKLPIDG